MLRCVKRHIPIVHFPGSGIGDKTPPPAMSATGGTAAAKKWGGTLAQITYSPAVLIGYVLLIMRPGNILRAVAREFNVDRSTIL